MDKDFVTDTAEHLEKQAETVKRMAEGTNIAMAEMRLQMETLTAVHKEEKADMRKHYGRIIMALILVICLIIGSIVGGVIYVLANYDIEFGYTQNAYNEVGGDNIINDGIHFNDGFRNSDN